MLFSSLFIYHICIDASVLYVLAAAAGPRRPGHSLREMGGAPWNLAPRNHFLVWIVKPSGCLCTDGHLTSRVFTEA